MRGSKAMVTVELVDEVLSVAVGDDDGRQRAA
jgi:hypothetical protein